MRGAVREQARAIVRVLDPSGEVVGAGFLIGPDLVATCAHVVADAAGLDPYTGPRPAAPLLVDLPLVRDATDAPTRLRATVLRWSPVRANGTGDIAVLQLERAVPSGARMPPLRRVDALWDHRFRVLGFPGGQRDGVWSTGRIRGEQGTRWFQLQSDPGDQAIVPGFSGSPVWDEASGAVVGMTVAADRSADTTTAYLIPIDQVLGLDPELLPCPYRGLEPFGEEHSAFFFGRDADIARLSDAVARRPMVAVAGPSGVGKSSLVRAGLVPRLRETGVRIVELLPGMSLDAALAAARRPAPVSAGGAAVAMAEPGLVVLVDQFEELAATDPAAARELLLQLDAATQRNGVRAVLTLRWESLAELTNPPTDDPRARGSALEAGSALVAGTVIVGPMDRAQLRDAVVGPAERAPGLLFEDGLVDTILDDAGSEPGQLPLVESLLTELWERRVGGALTVDAYRRAGGVAGAVAKRAEQLVAEFPDHADLRRLFTLLTRPDRAGRFVRRPAALAELAPELRALVPRLVAGRLLVVQRSASGAETVELAHQALIEHWPRLRDWLIEDRDFLAWRAQLEQQRERWSSTGQDDGALLRGTALVAAQQWLPARAADVAPLDQDYVQRSQARQRREVRRWRVVTAVLAVLVLVAGGLAAVAFDRGNSLDQRLRAANAENLGRESIARAAIDPDLATRLALAAWHSDPTNGPARTALASRYLAMQTVGDVLPEITDRPIDHIRVSGGGDRLTVLGNASPFLGMTGIAGPTPRPWTLPDTRPGLIVRATPDGSRQSLGVPDEPVQLWDTASNTEIGTAPALPKASLDSLNWSLDGSRLLWLTPPGSTGRQLVVWDLATRAAVPHGLPPLTESGDLAIRPTNDPGLVVVVRGIEVGDEPVRMVVRSLVDGAEVRVIPDNSALTSTTNVVHCEPTAQGSPEKATLVVFRPENGAEVMRSPLLRNRCDPVRLTADRSHVIERLLQPFGSNAVSYRLINLLDGARYNVSLPQRGEDTVAMAPKIYPAPTTGVVRGTDGTVQVLEASGRSLLRFPAIPEPQYAYEPVATRVTSDGATLVVTDTAGYATYERRTGRPLARIDGAQLPHVGKTINGISGDVLTLLVDTAKGWFVDRFSLPDLRHVGSYTLPSDPNRGPGRAANFAIDGNLLTAVSDNQLTVWDTGSNRMVAGPVLVDALVPSEVSRKVNLVPRRGHPGQVGIIAKNQNIEVWDAFALSRIAVMTHDGGPRGAPYSFVFSGDGETIAALNITQSADIMDLRTGAIRQVPIQIPSVNQLVGFTADGLLMTISNTEGGALKLTFWDLDAGREASSMLLSASIAEALATDARTVMLSDYGHAQPRLLPTQERAWRDALCRVASRPFVGPELAALPAGFDPSSPCTDE